MSISLDAGVAMDDCGVDWELLWFLDMYGMVSYAPVPSCTCRKSRCLKLYCVCFASGAACGMGCACVDCANTRCTVPHALPSHCTCKTGCDRMYCVCRQSGRECGPCCTCVGCVNCASSVPPRRLKRKHAALSI